jgi:diguanylate cyclase (GGDEF)-like protein/PAS domain S-box-containing protein
MRSFLPGLTRRGATLWIALGLYVVIFAARWAVSDLGSGLAFLYVLPIALLALDFGVIAGFAAGALAFALFCGWALAGDVSLSLIGYLTRAVIFAAVGWLVGRLATESRLLEDESRRWFETSNAMLGQATFDGCFTRVSAAWGKHLGFSPRAIIGKPYLEFVHPDDREATLAASRGLAASPSDVVNFGNRCMTKTGDWRWIRWNATSDTERIYAVGIDVTDLMEAQVDRDELLARVEQIARTDDLTGLPNRRAWDEQLRLGLSRSARRSHPLHMAMIDIDHFKEYNDAHGHQAGDALLRNAASGWRTATRDIDFIARYGGEEFAVLLTDAQSDEAVDSIIERLLQAVPAGLTCSAGVALWNGSELPEELVARADVALYTAKQSGRNCIVNAA